MALGVIKVSSLLKTKAEFNKEVSEAVNVASLLGFSGKEFTLSNDIGDLGELYSNATISIKLMKSGNYVVDGIDLNSSEAVNGNKLSVDKAIAIKTLHYLSRHIQANIGELYILANDAFKEYQFKVHDNFIQDEYSYVNIQKVFVSTMQDLSIKHIILKHVYLYKTDSDTQAFIHEYNDDITYHVSNGLDVYENTYISVMRFPRIFRLALKYINQGEKAFGIKFFLSKVKMKKSIQNGREVYHLRMKCLADSQYTILPNLELALELGDTISEDLYNIYLSLGGISKVKSRRDIQVEEINMKEKLDVAIV